MHCHFLIDASRRLADLGTPETEKRTCRPPLALTPHMRNVAECFVWKESDADLLL